MLYTILKVKEQCTHIAYTILAFLRNSRQFEEDMVLLVNFVSFHQYTDVKKYEVDLHYGLWFNESATVIQCPSIQNVSRQVIFKGK